VKQDITGDYIKSANQQDGVPIIISRRRKLTSCLAIAITGFTMLTTLDVEAVDASSSEVADNGVKKKVKKTNKAPKTVKSNEEVSALQEQVNRLNRELAAAKAQISQGAASSAARQNNQPLANGATPPATEAVDVAQAEALEPAKGDKQEKPKNLGEVVVRSRQRIEKLQDVPLSISVVQGAELDREQAMDLGSIAKRTSNLTYNQGNQRTSSFSIRGIGKIGQTEAQDPNVGIIVDGVNYAYNPLSSSYDFTDVDAVELTRGPQGTLQGKGATMGVVNILTKRPTFTNSADYSFTYGNYDSYIAKGAFGGAVIDDLLAFRGSFVTQKQRGLYTNSWQQDSTFANIDRLTGRAQFLLTPSENFNARLSVNISPNSGENTNGAGTNTFPITGYRYTNGNTYAQANTVTTLDRINRFTNPNLPTYAGINGTWGPGYYFYGGDSGYQVTRNAQFPVVTGQDGASYEMNWDVAGHHLTSITAYQDYHFNANNNDDGTPLNITQSGGYSNYYHQLSQELRINSKAGGLVDYTAGIFLMENENKTASNSIYGSDAGAWYATNTQYNNLKATASGLQLMQNSLNNVWQDTNHQDIQNKSEAIFGQTNFNVNEDLTLTTGVRFTNENRINPNSVWTINQGSGGNLNPGWGVVNGQIATLNNGFNVNSAGQLYDNGVAGGVGPINNNNAAQLALADQVARQYFGTTAEYTGCAGTNPGDHYNCLTAQEKQQVQNAKAIRSGQMAANFNTITPTANNILSNWVVSPRYKITDNFTTYVSWQHGQKAGIAQTLNGVNIVAKPETDNAYEIGLKSTLFDKKLILNTALFWQDIENYQTSVNTVNDYGTLQNRASNISNIAYTTLTGNVPGARTAGVELDGAYSGIDYTQIRFSGAYTDAIYTKFHNAPNPTEVQGISTVGAVGYNATGWNASGQTLPGASKFTFNISPEVRVPSELIGLGDYLPKTEFHSSFTETYASRFNSDTSLSNYAWVQYYFNTDFSFGIGRRDKKFDLSFVAKNLLNNHTPTTQTNTSYLLPNPQWLGIQLSGKF
jgi:outer membrane receptor protein involved in Fe transport